MIRSAFWRRSVVQFRVGAYFGVAWYFGVVVAHFGVSVDCRCAAHFGVRAYFGVGA